MTLSANLAVDVGKHAIREVITKVLELDEEWEEGHQAIEEDCVVSIWFTARTLFITEAFYQGCYK
jgi:hypothetical protein